jgi:putative membrane protein
MSIIHKVLVFSLGSCLAFAQSSSQQSGAAAPGQSNANNTNTGSSKMNSDSKMGSKMDSSSKMQSGKMQSGSLSANDRKFVMEAAEGGKMEVALGKMATEKASKAEVKAFGQMMVTDHTQANTELQALARSKGVNLPSAEKQDPHEAQLRGLSGDAFDRAYMSLMKEDHEKDVAEFRKESQSASDPDVKAFASKTLPTLEKHRERANEVAKNTGGRADANRMGGSSSSGTAGAATSGNNMDSQGNANKSKSNNTKMQGGPGSGK